MRATYRETLTSPPVDCEIVSERGFGSYICREVDRPLPGVWPARFDQLAPPAEVDTEEFDFWMRRNLQQLGAL